MSANCPGEFEFPEEPEKIPQWAKEEAHQWARLSEFDLLLQAEQQTGKQVDIRRCRLSPRLWGFTYTKPDQTRARIFINRELPLLWQQFALFHELYHLLHDARGVYFYTQTFKNLESVEWRADQFAWAAILESEQDFYIT